MGKRKVSKKFFAALAVICLWAVSDGRKVCYADDAEGKSWEMQAGLKEGQMIEFSGMPAQSYVYHTGEIEAAFGGLTADPSACEEGLVLKACGGVFENARFEDITVASEPDENELYAFSGKVVFCLKDVTCDDAGAVLTVTVAESIGADGYTYAASSADYEFFVTPKPLFVSNIEFEQKIYDGTDEAVIKSAVLDGVEAVDEGKVQINTEQVFHLTSCKASEEGWPLSDMSKLQLFGEASGKYVLNTRGCENFRARIDKRPIGICGDFAFVIQRPYFSDKYTKHNGTETDVYNAELNDEVFRCREMIYTNILEADKPLLYALLRQYHPKFLPAEAHKASAPGSYDIIAYNPASTEEPENYRFDFEGGYAKAGILKITEAEVEKDEFKAAGSSILWANDGKQCLYVRAGAPVDDFHIEYVCDGSKKYNAVEYVGEDSGGTYFEPSKAHIWPKEGGRIKFRLVMDDGGEKIYSQPYSFDFISDDTAEAAIHIISGGERITCRDVPESMKMDIFGRANSIYAEIKYSDDESGIQARYYNVVDYDEWYEEGCTRERYVQKLKEYTDWKRADGDVTVGEAGLSGSGKKSRLADGRYMIIAKTIDYVGNVSYAATKGITVDSAAPRVASAQIINRKAGGVYRRNEPVAVKTDIYDEGTAASGIAAVCYRADISYDGVHYSPYIDSTKTYNKNEVLIIPAYTKSDRVRGNPVSEAADAKNTVRLIVWTTDFAGNKSEEKEVTFDFDIAAPTISIVRDDSALNGRYFQKRAITVQVTDAYFDADSTEIEDAGNVLSQKAMWRPLGNHVYERIFNYTDKGTHRFFLRSMDRAGNVSEKSDSISQIYGDFIVDNEKPVIEVVYDNNEAADKSFYRAGRTAAVTIKEDNFSRDDTQISVSAGLNDRAMTAPQAKSFSGGDGIYKTALEFRSDGDYMFEISCTDLAGNHAVAYKSGQFTVDMTKPDIKITGVGHKSANRGEVAPKIYISDINFTNTEVSVILEGLNKGKLNIETMASVRYTDRGQSICFDNFGGHMDDIYTLTVWAADRAGNVKERRLVFSVNREGSAYILDDGLKTLIKTGITNSPKDITVGEVNMDTLIFTELTCSRNGSVVRLEEGSDYTVQSFGGPQQWKRYIYTIKAACFEKEGDYSINIYSEDRASNVSTNRVKKKQIEFVVDRTPPVIIVSDIKNGGVYKEKRHQFAVGIRENTKGANVKVYIDGEMAVEHIFQETAADAGTIRISLESKKEPQTIEVIAEDAAGNMARSAKYTVRVGEKQPVLYAYAGWTGLIFLSVSFGIFTAVCVRMKNKRIFLYNKKRRSQ